MDKFYKHQRVEVIAIPDGVSGPEWDRLPCEVRSENIVELLGDSLIFLTPLADRPDGHERTPFLWPVQWVRRA